jgi:hypothetical protein
MTYTYLYANCKFPNQFDIMIGSQIVDSASKPGVLSNVFVGDIVCAPSLLQIIERSLLCAVYREPKMVEDDMALVD